MSEKKIYSGIQKSKINFTHQDTNKLMTNHMMNEKLAAELPDSSPQALTYKQE